MISVFVPGSPAPQGSMKYMCHSKAGRPVLTADSKKTKPWRADVRSALLDDQGKPRAQFDGPIHIELEFVMKRPAGAPKRSTPPAIKRPDLDKLQRAVFDAVSSAGIWRDDSQVVSVTAVKRLAKIGETPGCHLEIMNAKEEKEMVATKHPAKGCSAKQIEAFEQIASGEASPAFVTKKTIEALKRKGLIEDAGRLSAGGSGAMTVWISRYQVPAHIHIQWCQWCAENVGEATSS